MADPQNPFLYQAWAASQPGNTINQWETSGKFQGGAGNVNDAALLNAFQGLTRTTPGWDLNSPLNNVAPDYIAPDENAAPGGLTFEQFAKSGLSTDALKDYEIRTARANDNNRIYGVFDPTGKLINGSVEGLASDSFHHQDWAVIAAMIAMGVTAGAGGAAALGSAASGGTLSGTSAAALGGAIPGAIVGGLQDQSLAGAVKGAALGGGGAAISSAAGQYFANNPGIDPATTAGGYTNQMDLASDAFSRGVDPANFSAGALNQMDLASDAYRPPGDAITDAATGNPVDRFTTNGNAVSPTGSVNNTADLSNYSNEGVKSLAGINAPEATPTGTTPVAPSTPSTPSTPSAPPLNSVPPATTGPNKLLAPLIGAGATLAAGAINNPGSPPVPGATGSTNTASRDAIITRLENQLWGPDAASGPDYSNVPALVTSAGDPNSYYKQAADAVYNRAKTYLDPDIAIKQQALEARLAEQGFVPGTPGYTRAMQTFQDTTNRAYSDARDSAVTTGVTAGQNLFANNLNNATLNNNASQTAFQQANTKRAIPFQEYSTLRTGVSADTNANNNAQLGVYNANVASANSTNQAVGNLANAAVQYFVPSDARLKSDIIPLGQTPGGVTLYAYTIFGQREVGVIAQELLRKQPAAVQTDHPSGYLHVDYSQVR